MMALTRWKTGLPNVRQSARRNHPIKRSMARLLELFAGKCIHDFIAVALRLSVMKVMVS
jgi:hypothetical protein